MKCAVCQTKKGKRSCLLTTSCICSVCCGSERKKDICSGCVYYREPQRDYKHIPFYQPHEMDGYFDREETSNVIESAISTFDLETDDAIRDDVAIRILELLLNVYHFGDTSQKSSNDLSELGFQYVLRVIERELSYVAHDELTKILGAIYFVAKRRSTGRREYLSIIRQHVGVTLPDGGRMMMIPERNLRQV